MKTVSVSKKRLPLAAMFGGIFGIGVILLGGLAAAGKLNRDNSVPDEPTQSEITVAESSVDSADSECEPIGTTTTTASSAQHTTTNSGVVTQSIVATTTTLRSNPADIENSNATLTTTVSTTTTTAATTGTFRYGITNGTITISGFNTELQELIIPAEIEGIPVTAIGDSAFAGCNIRSLTLPDTVTAIGANAFANCAQLENVVLPDSVISVGVYAFQGSGVKTLILSNGMQSIGNYAFYGMPYLQSIRIPDSVTQIGDSAFEQCEYLETICIPISVKSIGQKAFSCYPVVGSDVYYAGSSLEWDTLDISSSAFPGAVFYYNVWNFDDL